MRYFHLAGLAVAALIPLSACGQAEETPPPATATATTAETTAPAASADGAGVSTTADVPVVPADQADVAVRPADRAANDATDGAQETRTTGAESAPTRSQPKAAEERARTRDAAKTSVTPPAAQPMFDQTMPGMDHSKMNEMDHSNMPGMTTQPAPQ